MNWQNCIMPPFLADTASDAEIRQAIKSWRNQQLESSDWTQLPDIETDKVDVAAWRVYRQELRDMLDQSTDPKLIVFPTPPV